MPISYILRYVIGFSCAIRLSGTVLLFKSFFFSFLCRLRRDRFVSAIWKVKPIQKWEIDSLQGVLDEEKENQGNLGKNRL